MNKIIFSTALLAMSSLAMANDYVTPADMPATAQDKMFNLVTEYNSCMMQNRLETSQSGQSAQQNAEAIMQSCENHLDQLKTHLTDNQVEESLAEGMTKKLRSRAARQLMTKTMNNLAAQAAAMNNADKMQ